MKTPPPLDRVSAPQHHAGHRVDVRVRELDGDAIAAHNPTGGTTVTLTIRAQRPIPGRFTPESNIGRPVMRP